MDCFNENRESGRHAFAFSRRDASEWAATFALTKTEGAGKAGCPPHPQPRVRNKTKHTSVVTTGSSGIIRPSLRDDFNDLLRALPGDRAFLPPSPQRGLSLKNLTPASGCQDHTTSPSATTPLVLRHHRVHRIPPNVRDDGQRPSFGRDARSCRGDLPDGLSEIFLQRALDIAGGARHESH